MALVWPFNQLQYYQQPTPTIGIVVQQHDNNNNYQHCFAGTNRKLPPPPLPQLLLLPPHPCSWLILVLPAKHRRPADGSPKPAALTTTIFLPRVTPGPSWKNEPYGSRPISFAIACFNCKRTAAGVTTTTSTTMRMNCWCCQKRETTTTTWTTKINSENAPYAWCGVAFTI